MVTILHICYSTIVLVYQVMQDFFIINRFSEPFWGAESGSCCKRGHLESAAGAVGLMKAGL